jgi:hypothetical protein
MIAASFLLLHVTNIIQGVPKKRIIMNTAQFLFKLANLEIYHEKNGGVYNLRLSV